MVERAAEADAWTGATGYITKEMVADLMPAHGDGSIVFVCGPPPFMRVFSGDKLPDKSQGPLEGILKDLGYTSETVFKF